MNWQVDRRERERQIRRDRLIEGKRERDINTHTQRDRDRWR
jgi:hypothetical protein